MPGWLYVVMCLAVPSLWGVAMFYAFDLVAKRRRGAPRRDRDQRDGDGGPVDYSI